MPLSTLSQARKTCGPRQASSRSTWNGWCTKGSSAWRAAASSSDSVAEALEQHDARRAARLAQRHRLPEARDRERVGAGERRRRRREPVAVGIRLDDRDDPAAGGEFADPREVVSERRRVDDGAQRPVQNAPSP